jgi:hypothetical protein
MSAPAQVTEAQKALWTKLYNLAHDEIFDVASSDGPATQLIADSEAAACADLKRRFDELENRHLRLIHDKSVSYASEVPASERAMMQHTVQSLHDERNEWRTSATRAWDEREQLRAEVEEKRNLLSVAIKSAGDQAERAERAEAVLGKLQELHGCSQEMVLHWCEHAAKRSLALDKERSTLAGVIAIKMQFEAELAKERARLDWLEANSVSIYCAGLYDGTNAAVCVPNGKDHKGATIRAAIDAAIASTAMKEDAT